MGLYESVNRPSGDTKQTAMKKRYWLLLILIVLAAGTVIWLAIQAIGFTLCSQVKDSGTANQKVTCGTSPLMGWSL